MFQTAERSHTTGMERMLQHVDNPRHAEYKRVVAREFREHQVAKLEARMREIARAALRPNLDRGSFDFVKDYAEKVPIKVLMEMVGIPDEGAEAAGRLTAAVFGFLDDEMVAGAPATVEEMHAAYRDYILELAEQKRRNPQSDLLTLIATAEVSGTRLEGNDLFELAMGIILAGYDTTVDAVSMGMARLVSEPEQMSRLRSDSSLMPSAVEEMLRYESPVLAMRRTARGPMQVGGQTLQADDKIMMFLQSANYDESEFVDANRFDIGRTPNRHLTLGHGLHRCIGAWLTKAEMAVLIDEVLKNFVDIEIAGQLDRIRTVWVAGLKRLPIRGTLRDGAPILRETP
jgi:cytochrome P450